MSGMSGMTYTLEGKDKDGKNIGPLVRVRWETARIVSGIDDILNEAIPELLEEYKNSEDFKNTEYFPALELKEGDGMSGLCYGMSYTIEGRDSTGRSLGCLVRVSYEEADYMGDTNAHHELEMGLQNLLRGEIACAMFPAVEVPSDASEEATKA